MGAPQHPKGVIRVFTFNHGEHEGDQLTELGRRQVRAAARKHLANIDLYFGMASPHKRTQETLKEMVGAVRQDSIGYQMTVTELLAYDTAMWMNDRAAAQLASFAGNQKNNGATVEEMLSSISLYAQAARAITVAALISMAERARFLGLSDSNVLAIGHSPAIEMAADLETKRCGFASGILYRVVWEGARVRVVDSCDLPAPAAEEVAATPA